MPLRFALRMLHAKVPQAQGRLAQPTRRRTTGENSLTFHQHIGKCAKISQGFSIFIDGSMRQSAASENFRIDLTSRDIV